MSDYEESRAAELSIGALTEKLKGLRDAAAVGLSDADVDERRALQVDCLKRSLQAAVTLEFATIPPYLCALWSIKDDLTDVAKSIREVVQEEMLHMALACNMLTSLGETPQISSAAPEYPGGLPGGVHKGLVVHLGGLTKDALRDFLWIERPVDVVEIEHAYPEEASGRSAPRLESDQEHARDETIGEFYEEIQKAFEAYLADPDNPPLTPDNQITGPLAYAIIRGIGDVEYAIGLIVDQGEGSPNDPEEAEGDLSHYYRFLEVHDERKYEWNAEARVLEDKGPLSFPKVWPVARAPEGGYRREDVSDEVWYYLEGFDRTYTKLLDQLQAAWTLGGQAELVHAYETMFTLEGFAKSLMRIPIPSGDGATYGPCFRYQPANGVDAS